MKKKILKQLALALTLAVAVPAIVPSGTPVAVEAAVKNPSFAVKTKTINGIGTKYTLKINNKIDKAKYSWSSSNTKVAKVDYKGIVTAVKKGTATITCVVTKPNKSKVTLTCKITVKVPATKVAISNKVEQEGVHIIHMGDTYDFNRKLTPSGSTDKTYWDIKDTAIATVDKNGVVTPKKEGTTILTATSASSKTAVANSKIKDQTVIRVTKKSAEVLSLNLISGNEIEVKFSSAMNPTTLFDPVTKELKNSISVTAAEDTNKIKADNPGRLTGSLSEDGMTLTINAANVFNGYYDIRFSADIMTLGNIGLTEYKQNIKLVDNIEPYFIGSETDDTGLGITLKFSEPINADYLDIVNVQPTNLETDTLGTLKNAKNYLLSEDKKELKIDLSNISTTDQSKKNFTVQFSGIKDLAGNTPKNLFISASFVTDTSPKPQAKIVSIIRTGYNSLAIQYDRAIKTAGFGTVNGYEMLNGTIDSDNNKIVNYTLTQEQAALTGTVTVSVGYWDAYNVSSTDTSASKMTERNISFNVDTSAPAIGSYKLESVKEGSETNYVINLVFNKPVVVVKSSGSLASRIKTTNDDIISNLNLEYKAAAKDNVVTLTLDQRQVTESGEYTVTIPAGLVKDKYNNLNETRSINLTKDENNSTSMSGPVSIVQSDSNPSLVTLTFDRKLDLASAQNVTNYTVKGSVIAKAEVVQNKDSGAIVELTFAAGKIQYTTNYELIINGVKGFSGNYGALTNYKVDITLRENIAPTILTSKMIGASSVEITFSENIKGVASFDVYQNGKLLSAGSLNNFYIDQNRLIITLYNSPTGSSPTLILQPTSTNLITDLDGNPVVFTSLSARY